MTDIRIDRIKNTQYYWGKLGPLKAIVAPDEFVNGAKLAKSAGKKLSHWNGLKSTQSYMADLAEVTGIPVTSLSYEVSSGPRDVWGTYLHPDLVIQLANWCSNQYGILMTRVMREYHGKEAQELLAARDAELAASQQEVKERDSTIDDLRTMMARLEAKMEKGNRKTHSKLGVISEELGEVKDELGCVSRKLGVAKKQRVPPAKSKATEHVSVLLRLNREVEEAEDEDSDSSEDSEKIVQDGYDYSLLRIQRGSYSTSMANKRRNYPKLEVIKEWPNPNSMNIWHRYRDLYGHRLYKKRNDFSLRDDYSERRMIRHLDRLVQSRLEEEDLE